MKIKTYNGERTKPKENEFVFYIQNKGFYAGRTMREPKPNSWEVITTRRIDFEILSIVFESRILENFIIGSVIPFIRLEDYKKIIFPILKNAIHEDNTINEKYLQLQKIEELKIARLEMVHILDKMKKAISNDVVKKYSPI